MDQQNLIFSKLVSPTRGVPYTVEDLVTKAVIRAATDWYLTITKHEWEGECVEYDGVARYGDYDADLEISIKVGAPHWSESLIGRISGIIPIHVSYRGEISWGHGAHHYDVPFPHKWQTEEQDKYMIRFDGDLYVDGDQETEEIVLNAKEVPDEIRRSLLEMVQDFWFRSFLLGGVDTPRVRVWK